jgi:hypothetical protein
MGEIQRPESVLCILSRLYGELGKRIVFEGGGISDWGRSGGEMGEFAFGTNAIE